MKKETLEDKSRRSFIKTLLLGTGATIIGGSLLSAGSNNFPSLASKSEKDSAGQLKEIPDDPSKHWGFLIDLSKCDGCQSQSAIDYSNDFDESKERDKKILNILKDEKPRCLHACRKNHRYLKADPPQYWINVYRLKDNPYTPAYFFPKPCQNCDDPPCEHVCPTGATFKRKDGTVLINQKICIGCRICMAACPYETRFFWFNDPDEEENAGDPESYTPEFPFPYTRGTVVKCDYCLDRVYNGSLPSCVGACPQGAIYYGNLNENAVTNGFQETLDLRKALEEKGADRYKEEEGTNPSVFYIPPGNRELNLR